MTNILGTLTDSIGTPLDGDLAFRLPTFFSDDTTTPDTTYTETPFTFAITAGDVNIDVPATNEPGLAYRITFTPTGETTPTLDFNAEIPNVATVQFSALLPTGLTTTTLDTGAYRVARNIALDPVLAQLFKQPLTNQLVLTAQATEIYLRAPKPFDGPIRFNSLAILATAGFANWSFELGAILSDGSEEALTPDTTTSDTQGGRFYQLNEYDDTRADDVFGLYVRATPSGGASPITAVITTGFTEV